MMKEKIIKAGNEIVKNGGIKALTIARVVSVCKISKTTFYKHFSSREELLLEMKKAWGTEGMDLHTTKEKIIHQSREAFSNHTFDQIDLDTIAEAVGIKRTTIYRYFPSKEELLAASLESEISHRIEMQKSFEHLAYDPYQFLQWFWDYGSGYYNQSFNNLLLYNALYYSKSNQKVKSVLDALWKQTSDMMEYVFIRGIKEGRFKKDIDYVELAQMILSFIGGTAIFSYDRYVELGRRFLKMMLKEILLVPENIN